MIDNPFDFGNPISDPKHFFGRGREVDNVFSRLRNAGFGSSSIVGERRMGKTSLLNYLMHPSVRHSQRLDSDKYLFVYEDLQKVNEDTTPVQLWQWLLQAMSQCCKDNEVEQMLVKLSKAELITIADLTTSLNEVSKKGMRIVLLLDEFEHVTGNHNFGPDFFYNLRSLAIRPQRSLSLITSSRRLLSDLCHSEAIRSSPFFNIFAHINIPLFTENEARDLISASLNETAVSFTDADFKAIFQIAGTHPYFLQVACSFLFEAYFTNLRSDKHTFLLKEFEKQAIPQLHYSWNSSDDQEKIVLTTLALLERQRKIEGLSFNTKQLQDLYEHSGQTLKRLEMRSLLASKADRYCLFSTSFGEWICTEITATIRDQKNYNEWLKSNKGMMDHLSSRGKKELGEILPKISSKYRELIITWVSDPQNLIMAARLLKVALGPG